VALAAVAGGAHIVCLAQFDAEQTVALIRRHRVTHVIGGDDMFARIAAAAGERRFDSVRFSGFAAFHSTTAAAIAAAEAVGLQPRGLYGSSEVQALFAAAEGHNRLLGGGVPVSSQAEVEVRDPQTGQALPPGASGGCGSTRRPASSSIWKIRRPPSACSPPTAGSERAISAG